MARKRGPKSVSKSKCDPIYDIPCVVERICNIAAYCGMPCSTVSKIIRRKSESSSKVIKKPGPKLKLSEIIDAHILPFKKDTHGDNNASILQEDNCGPHRACSIAADLQNKDMNRMKRPAQSLNLNPIENFWCIMKGHLRKQPSHSKSPMDLFNILSTIWNSLPDSYFRNLVASMSNRVASFRKNRGGSTKY